MRTPIPERSARAWESFKATAKPKNPSLIFDRFIQQDWRPNPDKEAKKRALTDVIEVSSKADAKLLQECFVRWKTIAERSKAHIFTMKTHWRFATGLGRKGPLETGFTFHRYGFPILPGSSVKGLARAYALQALNLKEDHPFFHLLFGTASKTDESRAESRIGNVIFFDAIPASLPALQLDLVNPHYPGYYQGNEYPTDWQSPKPSYFLTVGPDQEFWFAVGWRGKEDIDAHKLAKECLMGGLSILGAGAKTSAGYGYFKP